MNHTEYFPIVNEEGQIIGRSTRKECHAGTFILHPVVHLHIFNSQGELYLQKRNMNKDIQPGKWDTAVGGHVDYEEEIIHALFRECQEELDITDFQPQFLVRYKFTSHQESELVHVFITTYDGNIRPNPTEISEGRFWHIDEITNSITQNVFTPNFEQEFQNIIKPFIDKEA